MPLKVNSTGGGSLILDAGSTASDITLRAPSASGTILTDATPGRILQVKQTVKTDSWYASPGANAFAAVPGLSVSITPAYATSKILVMLNLFAGYQEYQAKGLLKRNGTPIFIGDAASNRPRVSFYVNAHSPYPTYHVRQVALNVLDSPNTTSAVTYTVEMGCYSSYGVCVNRSWSWQDTTDYDGAPASTITAFEVAA